MFYFYRYCAYTIGDQSAMDDLLQMHGSSRQDPLLAGKLDSLIAESRGIKAASMSEITWRGNVIRVKNSKVIIKQLFALLSILLYLSNFFLLYLVNANMYDEVSLLYWFCNLISLNKLFSGPHLQYFHLNTEVPCFVISDDHIVC